MKRAALLIFLLSAVQLKADVLDPVSDLKQVAHYPSGTVLYRWLADINGDGKKEVFLEAESDYKQDRHDGDMPSWDLYLQNRKGGTFFLSNDIDIPESGGLGPGLPKIDPDAMYIGRISELRRRGILTVGTDYPRRAPPVRYIYAYTIEGDHFKQVLLAQYDPTKGPNPIYQKYLTEAKRTKVPLEKVVIPRIRHLGRSTIPRRHHTTLCTTSSLGRF
jgi:hypothetical protein